MLLYYYYYTTTDLRIQTEIFYNNEHQKISSLVHRGLTAPLTLPHEGTKCSRPMNNILKFPPLTKLKHPIFLQWVALKLINVWKIFEDEDQYHSAAFRNLVNESKSHFNSREASDWSQVNSLTPTLVFIFIVDMNYSAFAKHIWHVNATHTNFSALRAYVLHTQ